MPDYCFIDRVIDVDECVGNSLSSLNISLTSLDTGLCDLSAFTMQLLSDNPVNEIIRDSRSLCFTNLNTNTTEEVHLFGGIGPEFDDTSSSIAVTMSTWSSCYKKLPYITTDLSGTHLRFPSITASTDTDSLLKIAVFNSNNTLHSCSSLDLIKPNMIVKQYDGTSVITAPSAIRFNSSVSTAGSEVIIRNPLTLMSSLSTIYDNSSSTATLTTNIDVTTLSGYNANHTQIYLYYNASVGGNSGTKTGRLDVTVNGFPTGVADIQSATDKSIDSGYIFLNIPADKLLRVSRTAVSTTTTPTSPKPSYRSYLSLYGWAY